MTVALVLANSVESICSKDLVLIIELVSSDKAWVELPPDFELASMIAAYSISSGKLLVWASNDIAFEASAPISIAFLVVTRN